MNGASFSDINTKEDFWGWMKNNFVPVVFQGNETRYINQKFTLNFRVLNNYDRLFRGITLRQFRVKKNTCNVPDSLKDISLACVNKFSSSQEDKETFGNSLQ